VNPGAGRRRRTSHLGQLNDALAARAVDVHVTATLEGGVEAARTAFVRGDGVLACGGDGTVRAIAALAADVGGLLAIAPLGSGNDFARALGYDHRRPVAALDALDDGHDVAVDLGRVSTADGRTEWFTTVAHSGLDAEVNRWANNVTWTSGTALYTVAALRTMATYRPTVMKVVADGTSWEGTAWLVAVGNTHCYGGGMSIVPTAQINDGRLDVVIIGDISRAQLVKFFPQMLRGGHLRIEGVHRLAGASVEIDGPAEQEVYASGERMGTVPANIEAVPATLRVRVPEASPVRGTA
jgi:diacylglycerol kinase (ATP)